MIVMIEIKSLASGSSGNCYHITDGSSGLLIEAGIPIKKIKEGLNFRLHDVDGVLISHSHKDHCKAVKNIMTAGIDCYMSRPTMEELEIIEKDGYKTTSHRAKLIKPIYRHEIGDWIAKPFEVEHDVYNLGFLLWSMNTKEKVVYITDSKYTRYKIPKMNYIMVECNYSLDILNHNVEAGIIPAIQKKRVIQSHFGLKNVKDFLRANDLSQVREIWLLHLSDQNSDAERFKREIMEVSGKPVYIAE